MDRSSPLACFVLREALHRDFEVATEDFERFLDLRDIRLRAKLLRKPDRPHHVEEGLGEAGLRGSGVADCRQRLVVHAGGERADFRDAAQPQEALNARQQDDYGET